MANEVVSMNGMIGRIKQQNKGQNWSLVLSSLLRHVEICSEVLDWVEGFIFVLFLFFVFIHFFFLSSFFNFVLQSFFLCMILKKNISKTSTGRIY